MPTTTKTRKVDPDRKPRFMRPSDVIFETGLGRTKVYDLIQSGALPSVVIDNCRLIPTAEFERFIAERAAKVERSIAF